MRISHKAYVAGLTGAVVCALTACGGAAIEDGADGAAPGVSDETIKIGILADLTGPVAAIGEPLTKGAQAYVDKLNEDGGIDGREVELVVSDTQFNPQRAVQEYKKIREDVLGMVTVVGEPITAAVMPQADEDDMFFWPGTYSRAYLETEHPPVTTTYYYEALNGLEFLSDKFGSEGKTVSNFNLESSINTDYGDAVDTAVDVYGYDAGEILAKPATVTDYTGAVQTIASGDPDLMLVGTAPTQAASFLATGYSQGLRVPTMMASVAYSPTVLDTEAGSVLDDIAYVTSPWAAWESDEPGQVELREAVGGEQEPDVNIQAGWVMAKGLTDLIAAAAESGDLTRDGVKAELEGASLDFGGIAPTIELSRKDGVYSTTTETRIYKVTADGLELVKDLFTSQAAETAATE